MDVKNTFMPVSNWIFIIFLNVKNYEDGVD